MFVLAQSKPDAALANGYLAADSLRDKANPASPIPIKRTISVQAL